MIEIEGAIVTIDARGCQTEIADGIIERNADYVWAVKDNQPTRHAEIRQAFEQALEQATSGLKPTLIEHVERQQKRGRTEIRRYDQRPLPKGSSTLGRWRAAKTIGMVIRSRTIQGGEQLEAHYYLNRLPLGVKRFARAARGHWGIENRLHWTRDILFAQDASRIRKDSRPEIASMLRQLALMILQQDTQ